MSSTENVGRHPRKLRRGEMPSIKFRSSCDPCADAKVRCDKTRPHCGRCVRTGNGNNCRYGVSMRTAKTAMDLIKTLGADVSLALPQHIEPSRGVDAAELLQALLQMEQTQPPRPNTSSASLLPAPLPPSSSSSGSVASYQDHTMGLGLDLDMTDSSETPPPCHYGRHGRSSPPGGAILRSPFHDQADVMGVMDYFCTMPDDFHPSANKFQEADVLLATQPGLGFTTPPKVAAAAAASPAQYAASDLLIPMDPSLRPMTGHNESQSTAAPDKSHSCVRTAKALQQRLIMMSLKDTAMQVEYQNLTGISPATTTDQALLMCLDISKQIISILQCQCEGDAYLPFLMTVVISKVLAAYAAIARVDDSTAFGFGCVARATRLPEQQDQRVDDDVKQAPEAAAFLAAPLRLGTYDVDGELAEVLRAQLVLHELRKFEPVVPLFASKYCGGGAGGAQKNVKDSTGGEHEAVCLALSQFVEHRYNSTRESCECRSSRLTDVR